MCIHQFPDCQDPGKSAIAVPPTIREGASPQLPCGGAARVSSPHQRGGREDGTHSFFQEGEMED